MKRNNFNYLIAGTFLIFLGFAFGYFIKGTDIQGKFSGSGNEAKNISPFLTDSQNTSEELDNFPIYPDSVFVKKEYFGPCPQSQSSKDMYYYCDTVRYTWQTRDDFDQVGNWYSEDNLQTGWECIGGAGEYMDSRSASSETVCKNGDLKRALMKKADKIKTEFTLIVPFKEYKGEQY